MNKIKRQYGNWFARAAASSPTLVSDIKEARRRGVRILRVPGRCQAYSTCKDKLVVISRRCATLTQITDLAHELYHILHGHAPIDADPRRVGRRRYIRRLLEEETDCFVHEITVAEELLEAGYKLGAQEMEWVRSFRRGGRKAIRRKVERTETAVNGKKYRLYYGELYDEALQKSTRSCSACKHCQRCQHCA